MGKHFAELQDNIVRAMTRLVQMSDNAKAAGSFPPLYKTRPDGVAGDNPSRAHFDSGEPPADEANSRTRMTSGGCNCTTTCGTHQGTDFYWCEVGHECGAKLYANGVDPAGRELFLK
jgi:hypothetical protein